MPIPLIKIVFATTKIIARPVNGIIMNRLKQSKQDLHSRAYLIMFGRHCVKVENFIDRISYNEEEAKIFQVDAAKISEDAALNKGIEYFVEGVLFYGLVLSICVYEIKKSVESSSKLRKQIENLVVLQQTNVEKIAKCEAEMADF